ncbi:probable F-box protein At1g44080 [Rosa chinensis]|uniref:probable F-box protein At1g44080 n=1 Tax=Rosa chinensis TaxID=74649 RepID=UPI000D096F8D|nr:probable F-box protein At1g44080 [Rosa chinensis]XP_040365594.1 probable F-box protein At1g44080 [Rosa chinensis]
MAATFRKQLLADWSSLPHVILSEILDKLLEPTDHVRFAAICKEWHALATDYNHTTQRCFKVHPMLMIPSESQGKRKLYSISEQKVYNNFELPQACNSTKRCCGSSNAPGWLVAVDLLGEHQLSTTLVNVFKREVTPIRLPPLYFNAESHWFMVFPPKVILSADPIANPDNYMVVAVYDRVSRIAFIKGGQTIWTYLEVYSFFTDAIFYKRKVYAVGQWGRIKSFDVNSKPVEESLLAHGGYRFSCHAHKGYLVETTKGDLLHVRRFLKQKDVPRDHYFHYEDNEFWTESFKVYKVVFDGRDKSIVEQVELKSIGDEALFVGDNHSMCVLASNFPGCQPNSIYYTDDLIELGEVRLVDDGSIDMDDIFSLVKLEDETISNGPSDMGIFNLEDGSITQHYSLNPWHRNIPPAIWIMPLFNGLD